jgi:hypothetical protein
MINADASPTVKTGYRPTRSVRSEAKFPIGTKFTMRGKAPRIHTVIDFLTTRNLAGEIVATRYVTTHEFMGQVLTNIDVCETTIARGNPQLPSVQ